MSATLDICPFTISLCLIHFHIHVILGGLFIFYLFFIYSKFSILWGNCIENMDKHLELQQCLCKFKQTIECKKNEINIVGTRV